MPGACAWAPGLHELGSPGLRHTRGGTIQTGAGPHSSLALPPLSLRGQAGKGTPSSETPASLSHSPSSLPRGWAPDTASHRRHALSRSKRSPSGSRPSGSPELWYGWTPPLSVACTVPNAGYSIFAVSPDPPPEPGPREMRLDG